MIEKYEGSISDYERSVQPQIGNQFNFHDTTISGGTLVAGSNSQVTQNNGPALDELLRLMRDI